MVQGIGNTDGYSLRPMHETQRRLETTFRQLATGKRIDRASDDAAGLAIAARMHAAERSIHRGVDNLADGMSLANTAEGALDTTAGNLSRMRELAVQAQNGTLTDTDRAAIQGEYDQLAAEVTRTSDATSFAGRPLLDGSAGGAGAVSIVDGQGGTTAIDIQDQSAAALGVAGRQASDPNTITALDSAIDRLSQTRAELGATSNSLASRTSTQRVAGENLAAARSRIEDVDVARATADRTRDQILAQAQIALASHARAGASASLRLLA